MNKYAISLIIISIVGGIINSLASHFTYTKKYINYFVSLVAVICLLAPVISIAKDTSLIKDKINSYFDSLRVEEIINNSNNVIITSSKEAIANGIKNELIDKFQFDEKEIIIEIETDNSDMEAIKITKISIILTGKASWSDVDSVKSYLENIIGGNISVTRK